MMKTLKKEHICNLLAQTNPKILKTIYGVFALNSFVNIYFLNFRKHWLRRNTFLKNYGKF